MARVTLPLRERDAAVALGAGEWLGRFYPGICAKVAANSVEISGAGLSSTDLERAWRAALLNERLHGEQHGFRRALLEGLVR